MRKFRSPCACAKYHPGLCSPFIHFVVSNESVSGQWWPWSDCADAQADLGLRFPDMVQIYLQNQQVLQNITITNTILIERLIWPQNYKTFFHPQLWAWNPAQLCLVIWDSLAGQISCSAELSMKKVLWPRGLDFYCAQMSRRNLFSLRGSMSKTWRRGRKIKFSHKVGTKKKYSVYKWAAPCENVFLRSLIRAFLFR